ncbi:hypothetical protein A1Q2_07606 [Trichosporon asahii var. asahii CBS 8904]|uniref:STM1-like N-terminal domain-containing protein n=1 Tax=Trichosporon asahii var. asahii (strain CBS 8904) TaxID=1220162 RepID=K1VB69_TRIAC|nr:hypothetical protein A1Q2_07606 [Trichosporon asahii var. asahii CBS 8904]
MSVVSKNPFDLLGDDGEERSAGAPAAASKAKATPAPASQQPKVVPGAAPKGGRGARYPSRGGPRNVYREERAVEGGNDGFEGERVAPPRKEHQGRDRHTKGPREDRTHTGPRSRAPGAARGGKGARGGARGGAAAPAGEKKPTETWNNDEGKAELTAENQGEKDAVVDAAAPEEETEEAEPEDNSKTLDQYLAERAEAALSGNLGKKEARQVNTDDVKGTEFKREDPEEFFVGKSKPKAEKEAKAKKEKIFIPVDGQFASPARAPRTERPAGRGRGGNRGAARGQGAPRGNARGGARGPRQAAVDANDESSFPALGSK